MQFTPDQIARFKARRQAEIGLSQPQQQQQQGGGFQPSSLIQEGASLGSALGGAAAGATIGSAVPIVGTAIGGLIGAGLGGGLGSLFGGAAETKVRDGEAQFKFKDAAIDGALSAGPLRLLKGAGVAGKALKGGATAGQALRQGGQAGADFTLRRGLTAGSRKAANSTADSALGFSPTQFENIQKATGLDAQDIFKKENLFGASPKKIQTKLSSLNDEFVDSVKDVPAIQTSSIQSKIQEKAQTLINDPNPDIQSVGQRILEKGDQIIANLGGKNATNKAIDLNSLKGSLAKTVNYKKVANDPDLADVNKALGDAIRESISDASGSRKIQDLGLRIRDLTEASAPFAKQANKGRGSRVVNFSTGQGALTGGVAGGFIPGGPAVGALVGAAGAKVLNSPTAARASTRGLSKLSDSLGSLSSGASNLGSEGLRVASNQLLASPLKVSGQRSESTTDNQTITDNAINPIINPAISESSVPQQSTQGQITPDVMQNIALQLIQKGAPLDEVQQVMQELQLISSIQNGSFFTPEEESKDLTEGQQQRQDLATSLGQVNNLVDQGSINFGPIDSRVEKVKQIINAGDPETLSFQNALGQLRGAIVKARAGASLTEGEIKLLDTYTPKDSDSEQVIRSKIEQLNILFADDIPQ